MTAWETLDEGAAYTCEGFDIINQHVRLPDGTETEFDYLSETESVVILPFTPEGEVVVIDEWRQAVDRENRGLPAGGTEPNEDIDTAVHRELREETGYEAGEIEHLVGVEPANGFSDAFFHYYVAEDCEHVEDQHLDSDETISVSLTTFDDLLAGVRGGDLQDGRSAFGILYYALFGRDSR